MRRTTIQQVAYTLAVLLLLQEFSSARYVNRPHQLKGIKERERREVEETENNALQHQRHSRNRRSLAAVLMGTALLVSAGNIVFDVWLQIKGCCSLYPDACTYYDKFKASQANLETLSEETNAVWLQAEKKYTWVTYSNNKNNEIWIEVNRIMQLSETIVNVLEPNVIIALQDKNDQIKTAVESGNNTVLTWSAAQIDTEFKSLFDTQLGTIQHLSGVIGNVAEIILSQTYGWYKKVQIQNMLRTTYGQQLRASTDKSFRILGATDVDDLVKQTAKSRYNYDVATTRGHKIMSVASGVMSLVQIGVEIWLAVLKVKQCKENRDSIKDAYNQIKPQEVNMTDVKTDVDNYYDEINSLYATVKAQITSEEFLDYLAQIKNLTDGASTQNAAMTTASSQLTSFISGIVDSDEQATYNHQTDLVAALSNVTFTYECYLVKARTIANIESRCKTGDDTLQNLYTTVTNELGTNVGECTTVAGITYTTYSSIESYIEGSAQRNGYQSDCILNSADKQRTACTYKCSGYTDSAAATEMSLSVDQVTYLYSQCPATCPLTPNERKTVCTLKGYFLPTANIAAAVSATVEEVETVIAEDCP